MPTRTDNEPLARAWGKIIGGNGGQFSDLGRAGYVPVYDENYQIWRLFRNEHTIYELAENVANPAKVEGLRQNAADLVARYPKTLEMLEKLGLRVKRLLNSPIKTPEDVATWATSIFNVGPMLEPEHIFHTLALSYDDFRIRISRGDRGVPPLFVVPAGPRGSGNGATVDFTIPGTKRHFGPRHEYSKLAFAAQTTKPVKERQVAPKSTRPRGRPRADGLIPGSEEAKAADVIRRREIRKAARAAKRKALAPVIPMMTTTEEEQPRRRLARRKSS